MHTFRSLRHRNYRLYFIGQMISLVGSWMQTTALMWLAYDLTHQSKWPAFLMVAMIGPTLLLGAWSGSLADRYPKHKLIIRTQIAFLCSASLLTAVVFSGYIQIWLLLLLMFVHGIIQAIDLPSRLAFVPDLVEREDLINTVALNSVQFNVARALGPALAGLLLASIGPALCFLINACSYVAVLIALLMMRDFRERVHVKKTERGEGGFAVLRRQPRLMLVILLAGWISISGWPLLSLLPAYAQKVLGMREGGYSTMLSCVGVGALLAALSAANFGTVERQRRLVTFGICCVGAALAGLSMVRDLWLASLCCGLFGFGMILFFATGQALVQLGAQDEHRGKIMGIWAMMLSGGAPLGNLVLGPSADVWGVTNMIAIQAIFVGVAVVVIFVRRV
ncbi:MAG: MFS transporter [Planctomycetes bacterium]|nr:MFS transporter [Planctomycetota bacterium]